MRGRRWDWFLDKVLPPILFWAIIIACGIVYHYVTDPLFDKFGW